MRSAVLALLALWASSATAAGTATLQNDSFVSGSLGSAPLTLVTGEGWAATFRVEPDVLPVRLKKLQGLFVDDPTFPGDECGLLVVRVFEDTGVNYPAPDGPAIFDSELVDYGPGVPAALALQEFDLSTYGIWIDTPGFRVELHTVGQGCPLVAGSHYPVLAVDADGVSALGVNTLFTYDTELDQFVWLDTGTLGVSGDYILRAIVETTGCTPNCAGKECGFDGCQGTCGACPGDDVCVTGQCCTPDCQGKDCGTNGCGGSCGACGADHVCNANGVCDALEPDVSEPDVTEPDVTEPDVSEPDVSEPDGVEPEPLPEVLEEAGDDVAFDDAPSPDVTVALAVTKVVPAEGANDRETDVLVLGAGFVAGATVRLDADYLIVKAVTANSIEATVPIGLAPGLKTLVVQLPGGDLATLADAFTVSDASVVEASGGGSGCAFGSRSLPTLPALVALALGLVVLWRRASASIEG